MERLLPPCDAQIEAVRTVPDANSATGMLGKTRGKPEKVRNAREWARVRQTGGSPDCVSATQPKPDNNLTASRTVSGRRAVVLPRTGQRMLKESADSHIATHEAQQKKRLNKSASRRRKKKSQRTHERRRLWGVKRPWKWRVPRTKSRERNSQGRRAGWPQWVREMHRLAKTERKVLEMTSVDKDGSTDEIAIDETRLLQGRKAFARRRQRHNSKEKVPRMASERTETGDKEDRWRQREEGDVCHRQTAGKET